VVVVRVRQTVFGGLVAELVGDGGAVFPIVEGHGVDGVYEWNPVGFAAGDLGDDVGRGIERSHHVFGAKLAGEGHDLFGGLGGVVDVDAAAVESVASERGFPGGGSFVVCSGDFNFFDADLGELGEGTVEVLREFGFDHIELEADGFVEGIGGDGAQGCTCNGELGDELAAGGEHVGEFII